MKWVALVFIAPLLLVSCSGFPLFRHEGAPPETPDGDGARDNASSSSPQSGRVEAIMQNIHYDGETLLGRFLVTPIDQSLSLDKRLIETAYLTTESVSDCATGSPLTFIVMDVYAKPPRDEDILLLKPGYWYGKDVRIPLFTRSASQESSPACIEVEFAFRDLNGHTLTPIRVRAERSPQPPTGIKGSADAGTTTDAGASVDAGL